MAMASLIRGLHEKFQKNPENTLLMQIMNLRKRMSLIRNMQIIAIVSLLFSVFCMFSLFFEYANVARWLFGISLAGMSIALVMSAWEITISTNALEVELSDMQEIIEKKK
jgi:hypothetical protein